jgi:DNA gyrase inhibitor GyrI
LDYGTTEVKGNKEKIAKAISTIFVALDQKSN